MKARHLPVLLAAASCACAAALVPQDVGSASAAGPGGAPGASTALYVSGAARAGGDGSRLRPFATLAAVQRAAPAGATIVVLPSTRVLDGGIVLRTGQHLVGAGRSVVGLPAGAAAPRVENTTSSADGDAVRLADDTTVTNLSVVGSRRGGIYGANVRNVTISGNDLTGTNSSCTTGFVVQPFVLPTGVPYVGVPLSNGLPNGWASIMVDEARGRTSVSVTGNRVHDGTCSDGIDIRASGTAHVHASVRSNAVTRLQQARQQMSVLAIGMQATGSSTLVAELARNSETYIGTSTVDGYGNADSEGVFANAAGAAHLTETVDHNTFAHGLGHFSANCIEAVISNGTAALTIQTTQSTCTDVVGDILEAINLGTGSSLTFGFDHSTATHSTYPAASAQAPVVPGDDGDCLLAATAGAGDTTVINVRRSVLSDCAANGISLGQNVVDGSRGTVKRVALTVDSSSIRNSQIDNVNILNGSDLTDLSVRIAHSDLSSARDSPVVVRNYPNATTTHPIIDLGGGALGSPGSNCVYGGNPLNVLTTGYDVSVRHAWWNRPTGPPPGTVLGALGTVDTSEFLTRSTCGPVGGVGPVPHTVAGSPATTPARQRGNLPGSGRNDSLAATGPGLVGPWIGIVALALALLVSRRDALGRSWRVAAEYPRRCRVVPAPA